MKRRDFVKGLSLGTAAGFSLPLAGCSTNEQPKKKGQQPATIDHRNEKGEYIEQHHSGCPARSGMALGGIGTGSIELRKDGKFYNWSIFNNYPRGTGPEFRFPDSSLEDLMSSNMFFKVRYQVEGENPRLKLLQINQGLNEGGIPGMIYYYPWMESIQNIEYKARFPFINMKFSDPGMPFDIELEAFSPFIPRDVKNSSLPMAYFNFTITSKTEKKVDVMLIASLRNNVGYDTSKKHFVTDIDNKNNYLAVNMTTGGINKDATTWGQQVIASLNSNSDYYAGWADRHPYYEYVLRHKKLPNLDDTDGKESILRTHPKVPKWMPLTSGRNDQDKNGNKQAHELAPGIQLLNSSVAFSSTLKSPTDQIQNCFLTSWYFPNQYAEDIQQGMGKGRMGSKKEEHYYTKHFGSAMDVAMYGIKNREKLRNESKQFLDHFFDSSAPVFVLEQINAQLNTFVTSSRLDKDGNFGIQEGLSPNKSWGPIATTDVSLYGSVPVLTLFPELQKNTMRSHARIQAPGGEVAHGLHKNFHSWEDGTAGVSHRRDLPAQYVILVLRDYFWTNDREYLEEMWPSVKKAIEYAISDGMDRNQDGMPDMIGIRSSYDNFPMFGLSSYIQSQWLCAMASATEAARVLGDEEARIKYSNIFNKGKQLMDKYLWNGKYFRLYHDYDHSIENNYQDEATKINHWADKKEKDEGCLTDQIIGQWAAHFSGQGYILDEQHVKQALRSVMELSFKEGFGLRNASWPGSGFVSDVPREMWVDQGNTMWTGVELGFASFLLYEGFYNDGLKIIQTVDERYREAGLYWDHQEFGGHYYRPMVAWAILNAILGLQIQEEKLSFSPKLPSRRFKLFFATPGCTAFYHAKEDEIKIEVLSGKLQVKHLKITNHGLTKRKVNIKLAGDILLENIEIIPELIKLEFPANISIEKGNSLIIV